MSQTSNEGFYDAFDAIELLWALCRKLEEGARDVENSHQISILLEQSASKLKEIATDIEREPAPINDLPQDLQRDVVSLAHLIKKIDLELGKFRQKIVTAEAAAILAGFLDDSVILAGTIERSLALLPRLRVKTLEFSFSSDPVLSLELDPVFEQVAK